MMKNKYFWLILFPAILFGMMAFLFLTDTTANLIFGLPIWVPGFIVISLIYSLFVYLFSRFFWRDADQNETSD